MARRRPQGGWRLLCAGLRRGGLALILGAALVLALRTAVWFPLDTAALASWVRVAASTTAITSTQTTTTTTTAWPGLFWNETLVPLAGAPSLRFGRCALVGSSTSLLGAGLGREIDSQDTVIRVNRLPTEAYFADFGNRTDVYVLGTTFSNSGAYSREVHPFYQMLGSKTTQCTHCPFSFVVYSSNERLKEPQWKKLGEGWRSANLSVATQRPDLARAARCTQPGKREWWRVPSSGFDTFWTFMPLCGSIRLYGFGGGKTADKHYMGPGHDLVSEHEVYRKLTAGETLDPSFRTGNCTPAATEDRRLWRWLREDLQAFAKAKATVVL